MGRILSSRLNRLHYVEDLIEDGRTFNTPYLWRSPKTLLPFLAPSRTSRHVCFCAAAGRQADNKRAIVAP